VTARFRWGVLGLLLALRVPSLVQPAGADQSLYAYVGLRILSGGMPYLDAWDQKPPGIHLLYALFWYLWPDERVVALADLLAAAGVCWLLVVLGRRMATATTGWVAACTFALLANPSLQRLSGVFVRSQCETFIALAVTGALALLFAPRRRATRLVSAGVLLGLAIWLKYTAVTFALPMGIALWQGRGDRPASSRHVWRDALLVLSGTATVGAIGLAWLASHGALGAFWRATVTYNIAYSRAGYSGPGEALLYVLTLPWRQAQGDVLWFLGGCGVILGFLCSARRASFLGATWIVAAVAAIAINGRDLPQYFIQAYPALAMAAAVGFLAAWRAKPSRLCRPAVAGLLLLALWRVGTDTPVHGFRLASLPGLAKNIAFDLAYWRGDIDRGAYLDRFGGLRPRDKFAALDVEEAARAVDEATAPGDSILVFGFSPGIYLKSHRPSASRFFWSLPVILQFATDRPGYGSAGLLADLERSRPAMVVLQKDDWTPDSRDFFMSTPELAGWLRGGYQPAGELRRYVLWRRADRP
jgi:hypothetical protein